MQARVNEAWDRAFRGDLDGASEGALGLALAAHRALMGLEVLPPLTGYAAFESASSAVRAVAALGACLVARHRMLAFDRPGFDAALGCAVRLEAGCGESRATQWVEVLSHWARLFDGELAELPQQLEALAAAASRERFAELVIEANVLRAAVALELGDVDSAIALTRRVSRMARAEGMPHEEYLAHAMLARTRRRSERAHLASRILGSLLTVAPPPFHPWLAWEQRLSGDAVSLSTGPGGAAQRLIDACLQGTDIAGQAAALIDSTRGFAGHAREAETLLEALDPHVKPSAAVAWAKGAQARLPFGLDSVVSSTPNPHVGLAGNAWVFASPKGSRRVLHPGIGLAPSMPVLDETARKHGRTELATAVLALAGEGLTIQRFVREVYGFSYAKEAHDGMLRVLLHRMRANLKEVATVLVEDERITLRVLAPFWVPDPRTAPSSAEPVLRMIAVRPGASAKEIAAALAIPLRTVQAVLNQLIADGSCLADREAGGVAYRIEDTTFSDPTEARRLARE